jgi:hypothetical protein
MRITESIRECSHIRGAKLAAAGMVMALVGFGVEATDSGKGFGLIVASDGACAVLGGTYMVLGEATASTPVPGTENQIHSEVTTQTTGI